ncbi:MAG: 3-hydroxyacyl-CoA dehydrogenase [Anaerolineae bacterium]|nr:3-hydroxyacyl-CoA dehydrogenase [Anaerolineae bacterium]
MDTKTIRKVFIIGSGTMGQQIGLQCAMFAYDVILYDIDPPGLQAAEKQIKTYTEMLVEQRRLTRQEALQSLARIQFTSVPEDAADVDLISESIPEDPVLKAKVFAAFNNICRPDTIFTTNTSTLVPSMFADQTGRPQKFAAMHFHGYVWDSNVVDIMPHPGTSPETVQTLKNFAISIGQIPIMLNKENHQYVFNTMYGALNTAAIGLAANGVASVEDIDRAWMAVMKMPAGPFGIMDTVGLKTVWDITQYWANVTGDAQLTANAAFLKTYVEQNRLGLKTGQGFYTYPNPAFTQPDFLTGKSHQE